MSHILLITCSWTSAWKEAIETITSLDIMSVEGQSPLGILLTTVFVVVAFAMIAEGLHRAAGSLNSLIKELGKLWKLLVTMTRHLSAWLAARTDKADTPSSSAASRSATPSVPSDKHPKKIVRAMKAKKKKGRGSNKKKRKRQP